MTHTRKRLLILICSALLALPWSSVRADAPAEYEVKAAFIHNIAKFVEWPNLPAGESNLRLCILGQSPLTDAAAVLEGKQIGSRVWEVRTVDYGPAWKECQVLFIAASEAGNLRRILDSVNGNPVLTLGDSEGYAAQGVMINFYLQQNKVRFEINAAAASHAGLRISSQLLKLARLVTVQGGAK